MASFYPQGCMQGWARGLLGAEVRPCDVSLEVKGQILLCLEAELHPLPLGGAREGDKRLRKGWAASRPHLQPLRSQGHQGSYSSSINSKTLYRRNSNKRMEVRDGERVAREE